MMLVVVLFVIERCTKSLRRFLGNVTTRVKGRSKGQSSHRGEERLL